MSERFYIDCEFDGHSGPLLSMAVVREDGVSLNIKTTEVARDPWVIENVVPLLDRQAAHWSEIADVNAVGTILRTFMCDVNHPVIIADSPVDIGRFCAAISTGADGGWTSTRFEAMTFEVHNVDCYPTDLPGAIQHNAWWDALALRHKLSLSLPAGEGEGR